MIEHGLYSRIQLNAGFGRAHVNPSIMPISVEDALWVQQLCEAGMRLAWQKLEKRGKVLCTHML